MFGNRRRLATIPSEREGQPLPPSPSSASSSALASGSLDPMQLVAAQKELAQRGADAKEGKGMGQFARRLNVISNVNIMNHGEEGPDLPDIKQLQANQLKSANEARVKLAEQTRQMRASEQSRKESSQEASESGSESASTKGSQSGSKKGSSEESSSLFSSLF